MARVDNLSNFLSDVADAIRTKKGTEETIQASDFDTEIASIESGADISEYFKSTTNYSPFSNKPVYIDLIKKVPPFSVDNNVTSLASYFEYCSGLIDVGKITFGSNITSLNNLFFRCSNLQTIDTSGWDTSGVTAFTAVFNYCTSLTSLDLSTLTSESATDFRNMFKNCTNLTHIDIRSMTFKSDVPYDGMFGNYNFEGVPNNCEIIVKSQTEKEWITSKFSRLTNVKTVAEYEG